jgi:hypothetical protein
MGQLSSSQGSVCECDVKSMNKNQDALLTSRLTAQEWSEKYGTSDRA